jgi:hypothetical protein
MVGWAADQAAQKVLGLFNKKKKQVTPESGAA